MENSEILSSEEEMKDVYKRISKTQEEGLKNILVYFDRIHDKLFSFNNILIVGYFALSKIYNSMSVLSILIPICNLILLIYIEYRMTEKSRFESKIMEQSESSINNYGKKINNTNLISLLAITSTLCVTILFLYYLFRG